MHNYSFPSGRDLFQELINETQNLTNENFKFDFQSPATSFNLFKNSEEFNNKQSFSIERTSGQTHQNHEFQQPLPVQMPHRFNNASNDSNTSQQFQIPLSFMQNSSAFNFKVDQSKILQQEQRYTQPVLMAQPIRSDQPGVCQQQLNNRENSQSSQSDDHTCSNHSMQSNPSDQSDSSNTNSSEEEKNPNSGNEPSNNKNQPQIKNQKSRKNIKIKRFHIFVDGFKRQDIIVKGILRQLRKLYTQLMDEATQYKKNKTKNTDSNFFYKCTEEYVEQLLQNSNNQNPKAAYKQELTIILGSIINSKQMKTCISDQKNLQKVELFNDILYKYANKQLEKALKYEPFRFLLAHFMENFSQNVIKKFKEMGEKHEDVTKGLQFLSELIRYYTENKQI